MLVSTTNDVPGYRIVKHLGIVRGITVRSRSVLGNFAGGIQSLFGGKLSVFVSLAETARQEAYDHLCEHATQAGANAGIGMRYDANEIIEGITEVLAYGTAAAVGGDELPSPSWGGTAWRSDAGWGSPKPPQAWPASVDASGTPTLTALRSFPP